MTIIKNENETTETDTNDVRKTIERMSLDPTKSLMQNLKDIKRVVDSFLGDKQEEDGRSFLRKSMEERLKTPEKPEPKAFPEVAEETSFGVNQSKTITDVSKVKTKQNISTKKPIPSLKIGSTTPRNALTSTGSKSKAAGGVIKQSGAAKKRPLIAASGNKIKTEKSTTMGGKNVLSGSTSANKVGRVSRTKTVTNKK